MRLGLLGTLVSKSVEVCFVFFTIRTTFSYSRFLGPKVRDRLRVCSFLLFTDPYLTHGRTPQLGLRTQRMGSGGKHRPPPATA